MKKKFRKGDLVIFLINGKKFKGVVKQHDASSCQIHIDQNYEVFKYSEVIVGAENLVIDVIETMKNKRNEKKV